MSRYFLRHVPAVAAQYHHTHWFAFVLEGRERHIYDVNVPPAGGWLPSEQWKSEIITAITREHPRANGKWSFRAVLEVILPSSLPTGATP